MPLIGSWHASVVDRLNYLFMSRLGKRVIIRVQSPIVLGKRSEPQPDISVLRPDPTYYAAQHPGPDDVFFLVEVVDTTASYDRRLKLPGYATKGVEEVWILDLNKDVVEVHRRPALRGYQDTVTFKRGARIAPLAFPSKYFRVAELLG
jgi:Uma2 family endonuclease